MGFFKDLTAEIDRSPAMRLGSGAAGGISEVLKYAPTKLRPRRNVEERLHRLEAETRYWRERACQAEVRVKRLETSIQGIAQRVGIASRFVKSA
jgi:hypothetical protein